ncbi:MAG: hypothetical protein RBG1_1C00001G0298 [candidate division Zixibacteria bacterium RBG-1]|nr:MAG: hypothetical protein RBG1_1C00001G0298 [candidate division Zixibacteria bacterium RBG-1]OGC86240.1 MAG: hypothetical protein A2V73_04425 [candidate division Zixibacteria bacterium RBG_19FT_COMBO_42_43]
MFEYEGILATTSKLPDGFSFSREELEALSEEMNARIKSGENLKAGRSHRPDLKGYGRITKSWVDKLESKPAEYALYIKIESKEHLPEGHGLSISFFGKGISIGQSDAPLLTIGIPPQKIEVEREAYSLGEFAKILGTKEIELRFYFAHDLISLTQGAIVFVIESALTGIIGGFAYAFAKKVLGVVKQYGGNRIDRVQITAHTPHGRVEVYIPSSLEPELIEKAIIRAIEAVDYHHKSESRNFNLGIQIDKKGDLQKTEID